MIFWGEIEGFFLQPMIGWWHRGTGLGLEHVPYMPSLVVALFLKKVTFYSKEVLS